ncbi:hypothetical protein EDB98_12926 [Pseudomonas fluorescens]|jgi:hypothetical protein|nr:hypothetical protein EDB98_12926 [Pseudomonas fluorescens]SFW80842.1 hypothetical protein SAMN03159439_05156 [Pseudomonas sp. NFACC04-2]
MPSLGEAPSGGAEAFWLLLRFSKVTRRQGGTLSGRYRRNGYVPDHKILASCLAAINTTDDQAITGARPQSNCAAATGRPNQ